jgi:hypothetical protein
VSQASMVTRLGPPWAMTPLGGLLRTAVEAFFRRCIFCCWCCWCWCLVFFLREIHHLLRRHAWFSDLVQMFSMGKYSDMCSKARFFVGSDSRNTIRVVFGCVYRLTAPTPDKECNSRAAMLLTF